MCAIEEHFIATLTVCCCVRGYLFILDKRLFVVVYLFGLDKSKRQAMLFSLAFCVVGMTGFEPATPTSRT